MSKSAPRIAIIGSDVMQYTAAEERDLYALAARRAKSGNFTCAFCGARFAAEDRDARESHLYHIITRHLRCPCGHQCFSLQALGSHRQTCAGGKIPF